MQEIDEYKQAQMKYWVQKNAKKKSRQGMDIFPM